MGPGKSLENDAREAQAALAAGDTTRVCRALNSYLQTVRDQRDKKILAAEADSLLAEAQAILTRMGSACTPSPTATRTPTRTTTPTRTPTPTNTPVPPN